MIEIAEQELGWLKCFFSGRNALTWEAIATGTAPDTWLEQVMPWLNQLADKDHKRPIVLPVFDEQGSCHWYASANDENQAAALAEDLMACVGPSYSDFRGLVLEVDQGDPIESALHKRFGRYLYRFNATGHDERVRAAQAIARYFQILQRRPAVTDRTQQPFGKLRGDFDRALLAGNEARATLLLEALVRTGRVDAAQRQYLEIRRLAGLGRGADIARNYSLLRSILDLPLPPQTLTDVVDALYTTYIADSELASEPATLVATFKSLLGKPFGPLFRERKGVRHPNVLKAFLLYELSQSEPSVSRCNAIISATANPDLHDLLERWTSAYPVGLPDEVEANGAGQKEKSVLASAKQAMADEDYEIAVSLCFDALPDKWAYSALLRCAAELGDRALSDKVLAALTAAGEAIRTSLSERDLARLAKLQGQELTLKLAPSAGQSWLGWCEATIAGTHESPPLVFLEKALPHWQIEDYLNDAQVCQTIADRIANAQGKAEQIFREVYAQLVEFFAVRPGRPVRAFAPLYGILVKMIAWSGGASADELALTTEVVQAFVSAGPKKSAYAELIEDLNEILEANRAVANVDWALNTAELLAVQPAPDESARLLFFMKVVDLVSANLHRVTAGQRLALELLSKDFNCTELIPNVSQVDNDDIYGNLTGNAGFGGLIGLYTLTESAGQRAKRMLQKLLPEARVELNNDHAATDRLRQLAVNADVFVFAWKSSKHQAYYCVKEARGDRGMQMPLGKGSASIINSVFDQIAHAG